MMVAALKEDNYATGSASQAWLLTPVLLLIVLGVVMVYSASVSIAERTTDSGTYFALRHVIHLSVGLVVMYLVSQTSTGFWQKSGPYLLVAGMLLLAVVLVPGIGSTINGSSRWLRFAGFNVQPSEFMKLIMVIYVAGYLVRRQEHLKEFVPGIVMISMVVAVVGVLLLQEPDLGTLVVISATVFSMLFLAGIRFSHFILVATIGVGGMALLTLASPYRFQRITGFMDPWADPFNTGFQLVQALIAFGRGELLGVGIGASVQKLSYLPAAHTDFILAVLAEELGFIGVSLVIALFSLLVYRALKLSRISEEHGKLYGARLAQGVALLLGWQAAINMAVNMGLLPTKGLTLPFMSYGGSSLVATCFAIGLLLAVQKEIETSTRRRKP